MSNTLLLFLFVVFSFDSYSKAIQHQYQPENMIDEAVTPFLVRDSDRQISNRISESIISPAILMNILNSNPSPDELNIAQSYINKQLSIRNISPIKLEKYEVIAPKPGYGITFGKQNISYSIPHSSLQNKTGESLLAELLSYFD